MTRLSRGGSPVLSVGMVCGPYRVLAITRPVGDYPCRCICVCGCGRETTARSFTLKKFLRGFSRNRACIRKESATLQSYISAKRLPREYVW
jgi:hypothetical protein